ncbi:MAG TPA: hypothetical protein VGL38_07960 [bacterium]|jgi:hypothetical protein
MKATIPARTGLRSAIMQLEHIAQRKRLEADSEGRDAPALIQEARQLDEALRLLRWISA